MNPGRFWMLAAAGVMTAGALIGGTGTGDASAAPYTHLCEEAGYCMYAAGPSGVEMEHVPDPSIAETNWVYPNSSGAHGSISQANTQSCLQVNASGQVAAGEYPVRAAACVGDAAEQWQNYYDPSLHRTQFISVWGEGHKWEGENLCLSSENDTNGMPLEIMPCVIAYEWGTS